MKHSVPKVTAAPGGFAMAACVHCRLFGAKDGEEGCGGKEEFDAIVARFEERLRKNPPQLVFTVGLVESVDPEDGTFRVKVKP